MTEEHNESSHPPIPWKGGDASASDPAALWYKDPVDHPSLVARLARFLRRYFLPIATRAAPAAPAAPAPKRKQKRRLTREDQAVLANQTYAPASLRNQPRLLRAYLLLHREIGGARPWTGSMADIAAALNCSTRQAQECVAALEAAKMLTVERRPGQESEYRLQQEAKYIEMPRDLAWYGNHAVCAVWAALRSSLGRGRSALRCATAVTRMAWSAIQALTGLCRSAVAEALRWLRKHGWLSRQVVWASLRPIRRAVCQWTLRLRTPEENRTRPRHEPGQLPPSGGSRNNYLEPQAGSSYNLRSAQEVMKTVLASCAPSLELQAGSSTDLKPAGQTLHAVHESGAAGVEPHAGSSGQRLLDAIHESGAKGVDILTEWVRLASPRLLQ